MEEVKQEKVPTFLIEAGEKTIEIERWDIGTAVEILTKLGHEKLVLSIKKDDAE